MSDTELETEFIYTLKHQFSYTLKGEITEASFITLSAPTSKTTRECAALKQAFFRAMSDRKDDKTTGVSSDDIGIEGDDVISLLAVSTSVDLPEIMDVAKKLFQQPGIALVDGETKFGAQLIDRMSIVDFEGMLGDYLVNFTLASALTKLNAKSSEASAT